MQSSAMVALRTMTMIVCLVAVPLAAVLGTTLPKVVKSAFGGREARQAIEPGAANRPDEHELIVPTVEPHQTEPQVAVQSELPRAVELAAPRVHITGVQMSEDAPPTAERDLAEQPPIETAPLWNPSPRTATAARSGQTTTHFVPPNARHSDDRLLSRPPAGDARPTYGVGPRPGRRDDSLRKTVYSPPDDDDPLGNQSDAPPAEERLAPVERVSNDGALADGQRRLRALGVKYYRLEPWGGEGALYRCSCNVPLAPGGRASRHFDAIETAPSRALEAVVEQVEAWRARR